MTDTGKVRILGNLFLKLETKGRDGTRKKLVMLFISYLIPGVFIPFLLYKQSLDASGFYFAFLTYLFYSFILSFTTVTEIDNLILTKPQSDLMTSLPVNDNILARAKLFLLVRYVFVITLPLLIPGSIYYYLTIRSFPHAVLYFFSGLMFCTFLVNIIVLIYSIAIKNFRVKRIGIYTLLFQVILIFLLIISYQFLSFAFTGRYGGTGVRTYQKLLFNEDFTKFFPQAWFAFIPAKQSQIFDYRVLVKTALPVFITYMSILSLKLYLIENYGSIREKYLQSRVLFSNENISEKRITLIDLIGNLAQKIYIRNHIELSAFGLMQNHLKRDNALRVGIIPMFIIPTALALFAIFTDRLPSPFGIAYFGLNPVFHISIFLAVLIVINTAVLSAKLTGSRDASWVYGAFPLGSKKRFKNGTRKFFVLYLILPVCIILFIIFSLKISFYKALIHTLFIFTFANLYNSLFHTLSKALPFTKESTLVHSLYRLGAVFYPVIFGAACITLQIYVYQKIPLTLLTIAAAITITFWLNFFAFVKHKD